MKTTAETPTCQRALGADYFVHTSCGQTRFPDVEKKYTYCPNCGRKVEGVEENNNEKGEIL